MLIHKKNYPNAEVFENNNFSLSCPIRHSLCNEDAVSRTIWLNYAAMRPRVRRYNNITRDGLQWRMDWSICKFH